MEALSFITSLMQPCQRALATPSKLLSQALSFLRSFPFRVRRRCRRETDASSDHLLKMHHPKLQSACLCVQKRIIPFHVFDRRLPCHQLRRAGLTPVHRLTVFGKRRTLLPSAEEVELFSTTLQRHESSQSATKPRSCSHKYLQTGNQPQYVWISDGHLRFSMQEQKNRVLRRSHALPGRPVEACANAGHRNSLARPSCIWLAEVHIELGNVSSLGRIILFCLSKRTILARLNTLLASS